MGDRPTPAPPVSAAEWNADLRHNDTEPNDLSQGWLTCGHCGQRNPAASRICGDGTYGCTAPLSRALELQGQEPDRGNDDWIEIATFGDERRTFIQRHGPAKSVGYIGGAVQALGQAFGVTAAEFGAGMSRLAGMRAGDDQSDGTYPVTFDHGSTWR